MTWSSPWASSLICALLCWGRSTLNALLILRCAMLDIRPAAAGWKADGRTSLYIGLRAADSPPHSPLMVARLQLGKSRESFGRGRNFACAESIASAICHSAYPCRAVNPYKLQVGMPTSFPPRLPWHSRTERITCSRVPLLMRAKSEKLALRQRTIL